MKLLPLRLSRKPPASQQRLTNTLPAELLVEIASHLAWALDVLNFSLTSSRLRTILLPELYRTVFLFGGAWSEALEMFARCPELCGYIRRLEIDLIYEAIRPGHWQEEADIDEISMLIEKASAGLKNLQTFTWCGRRLPPDPLLRTLRNSCPQLKNLHCLTKVIAFDPASELFKFDDLTGFTLWVSHDEKASDQPTQMQDVPVELGDMLLQRCPNLDSLSIRLRSSPNIWTYEYQIDRLLSGFWPKLRFCHFDIEIFDATPVFFWPPLGTFKKFLSVHPSITELVLIPYSISPTTFSRELPKCLESDTSGQLTYFEGLIQHVAELPNPAALKILILSTVVTEASLAPLIPVLRTLTSLREFTIEFDDIDPSAAMRDIVGACPILTTLLLKFYKTTFSAKQLCDLSSYLKPLLQLRSLHLDKEYSATHGTLLKTALMLLADMPLLDDICILNFRDDHWCQRGHYLVVTDTKGRRSIRARETGWDRYYPRGKFMGRVFPRGKFNRVFSYSLERDLRESISKRVKRNRR
ncbi:hypothetical protein C8R45DRAFT_1030615 [Mycena sanguinolenta]|nr:hypothetical protein C8R45DRAFT_1030615 [Mycena sanguinolenta]